MRISFLCFSHHTVLQYSTVSICICTIVQILLLLLFPDFYGHTHTPPLPLSRNWELLSLGLHYPLVHSLLLFVSISISSALLAYATETPTLFYRAICNP